METAADHSLQRAGDIADKAIQQHHKLPYAERINALLDALHLISNERIEYINKGDQYENHQTQQPAA